MTTVFDVAEHILAKYSSSSAIKLQKLVYYSQAWSLASNGTALFPEPIIAYQYGPLCTTLWETHRGQKTVHAGDFAERADGQLSTSQRSVIDAVLAKYGAMSMTALVDRTHREQPWIEASKLGGEITPESMKAYYSQQAATGGLAPELPVTRHSPLQTFGDTQEEEEDHDDFSAFLRAIKRVSE
jgi:uncharacterized phage-associated protein